MSESTNSLVMMALGDFRFALHTAAYQTLERETSWRWPGQESVGDLTRRQFVGPGDDTIRLAGVVYPAFRGGLGQLDEMRSEASKGEPLRMVCGRGVYWGRWGIVSIRERQTAFFSNGAPRSQEFELSLVYLDNGTEWSGYVPPRMDPPPKTRMAPND